MKKLLCCILYILSFTLAFAQVERIDTDRPDQTESACLIPTNWVQLEMGMNYQVNNNTSNNSQKEYLHPTLLSKYGVSKNIELRLITTVKTETLKLFINKEKKTGFEPVEIGAKIRLWEEKKGLPKTSLIFHFAISKLASKAFQVQKLAPNFRFTMQHSLGGQLGLGYNIGAEWDGFSNKPTWIYTFAPGINIGKRGYAYVEAFGFVHTDKSPEHSIDGGLAYYVTNNFKLDISSGVGITSAATPFYFAIGASFRFNTKH